MFYIRWERVFGGDFDCSPFAEEDIYLLLTWDQLFKASLG